MERVRVKDFQSIADADLELGQFTVLVGPSSTGKSALLRALRLVFRNASGTGFVRTGQKAADVEVEISPAQFVGITKGKGVSEFRVDGAAFPKSGTKVPDPVEAVLRIGDESLSTQHDTPFMLADSGSEVAAILGKLTGADLVQEASAIGQASARKLKTKLETAESALVGLEADLEALPDEEILKERAREAQVAVSQAGIAVKLAELVSRIEVVRSRAEQPRLEEPPSGAEVEAYMELSLKLHTLIDNIEVLQENILIHEDGLLHEQNEASRVEFEIAEALKEANICDHCPVRLGV